MGVKEGLNVKTVNPHFNERRSVNKLDESGNFIENYLSIKSAANRNKGTNDTGIIRAIANKKVYKNFKWEYANTDNSNSTH